MKLKILIDFFQKSPFFLLNFIAKMTFFCRISKSFYQLNFFKKLQFLMKFTIFTPILEKFSKSYDFLDSLMRVVNAYRYISGYVRWYVRSLYVLERCKELRGSGWRFLPFGPFFAWMAIRDWPVGTCEKIKGIHHLSITRSRHELN